MVQCILIERKRNHVSGIERERGEEEKVLVALVFELEKELFR